MTATKLNKNVNKKGKFNKSSVVKQKNVKSNFGKMKNSTSKGKFRPTKNFKKGAGGKVTKNFKKGAGGKVTKNFKKGAEGKVTKNFKKDGVGKVKRIVKLLEEAEKPKVKPKLPAKTEAEKEEVVIDIASKVVNQAIEGVRILCNQLREKTGNKKGLLDDDEEGKLIFLQVGMVKVTHLIPRAKHLIRPVKIKVRLPNSVVDSNTEVLLITKDADDKKDIRDDHTDTLHHYQHKLRVCGAARHINEVITLRQLKVEFKEYEAKRHLANRTDVVLCDDTIIRRIPMFLGKHFYKKNKIPMQVDLKAKNLLAEIERALSMQLLVLPMTGNSALMKIGRMEQTNEMIEANIRAAIDKFRETFPGGWANVQSLSLKAMKTKSVPFYAKLSSANTIGHIKPKPLTTKVPVTGELSAQYGDLYTVYPDHSVNFTMKGSWYRKSEHQKRRKEEGVESLAKEEEIIKKLKETEDSKEDEGAPKKKKKVSKAKKTDSETKTKKKKKPVDEIDSLEDDELEKMEREYLKRISMEQENEKGEGKSAKESDLPDIADDAEDDWAEVSDFDDDEDDI